MAACVSTRQTASKVSTSTSSATRFGYETRDTVVEQVMVEVHDTIREVTTITVATNDAGDTLKLTTVTDRFRGRAMADVRSKKEDVRVRVDTIYVERRNSVATTDRTYSRARASPVVSGLKWVFWIIISFIVLIISLQFRRI